MLLPLGGVLSTDIRKSEMPPHPLSGLGVIERVCEAECRHVAQGDTRHVFAQQPADYFIDQADRVVPVATNSRDIRLPGNPVSASVRPAGCWVWVMLPSPRRTTFQTSMQSSSSV